MKKALLILALIGFFARLWQFGAIPVSLYWDEAAIGLDARSLLQTGHDLNGNSWFQPLFISYGDYKAPVYIWLTTVLGKFLGVFEITVRLPSLLALLGVAWILFKWLGYFSAISFLIMPWSFHFSRIGFESHLSLFWLVLMVYLMIKKKVIFSALALILGIYTYLSLRFIGPVLFLTAYWLYARDKWKKLILTAVMTGLSLFWLLNSPEYPASQQYRLSNDNLVVTNERKLIKLQKFIVNYSAYFDPQFLLISGDPNLRHHSGWGGELLLVQGGLLVLGLVVLIGFKQRVGWLMLVWLLVSPAVAALVNETPHASRAIYLMVPLAWLIGLGWQQLKGKLSLIITILLLINFGLYLHDYFKHYPIRSAAAWIRPYKDAAQKKYDKYPVYINPKLYKPELYFAFYQNNLNYFYPNDKFYYYLPSICPTEAICLD